MTVKAAAHFIDSDITGTSGLDDWQSNNYEYPPIDETKIQISTPQDLQDIQDNLTGDYEIIVDLDMTDFDWIPIGTASDTNDQFRGTLDGRYHTISNLTYNGDDTSEFVGIFEEFNNCAISNLRMKDFVFSGKQNMGALVGRGQVVSNITNCHVNGIIITSKWKNVLNKFQLTFSGGLVGDTDGSTNASSMNRCSAINVSFRAEAFAKCGGLSSGATGTCTDCYSQGAFEGYADTVPATITGASGNGGFTAEDAGIDFVNCYAAFAMPSIFLNLNGGFKGVSNGNTVYTDCFWDTTVSGTSFGTGGGNKAGLTGKTTTQMYAEATFTNWDFDTIWQIDEGIGYPTHQWLDNSPDKIKTGEQNRTTAMPTDHAHLNGQTVQGLGDGSYLGTDVVAGGQVTMDDSTTVNHVGLQYTSTILPMKLGGEVHVKRVSKIIPNVNETVGGTYGRDLTDMDSMVLRDANDPLDTDAELFSGHVDLPFDGTLDRSADIYIQQTLPLPYKLLGIGVNLSQEAI